MFIYDRSKDPHASLDTNPPLRSAETEAHQREASGPGLYPRGQVTRLIMDTAARDQEEEAGDRRTPVDLQDIVEKLNAALVLCRKKNNLQLEDSHDQEDFYNKN